MPFEIPDSWEWTTIGEIASSICYGVSESAKETGKYKLLRITDIQDNKVEWNSVPFTDYDEDKASAYLLQYGDILFARTGATVGKSYLVESLSQQSIYASYLIRVQTSTTILPQYIKRFFESGFYWEQISLNSVGIGQPNVNGTTLANIQIPIPPYNEQLRIVGEVDKWLSIIDGMEEEICDLKILASLTKSNILDFAIHGKLVPQNPNDESAIELLKRINPHFTPCDTSHYANLPQGWTVCKLEDIIDYEQPQEYIVKSTDYKPQYKTPVLTAGKSFIIGYTNEENGVFLNLPVIIFDDFTTESKFVDFPFKVKSSAMKILHVKDEINIEYVSRFMSITKLIGDTHKRYWISEYSKIPTPIPPRKEQDRITKKLNELFMVLDTINSEL